ncbi:flagellar hook-length control protein FliK [Thioalkalivibrio sp. ALJ16]|uniref:flagellar hook-length control protein FliK n=1 Tax=Thioalkalivibrio sp. ALJ16 TaxID=1158762 RepID=UPI000361D69A|nr:flagellar hook-length control protein FliK [Thioalkalivibrio sp. ALJ16]
MIATQNTGQGMLPLLQLLGGNGAAQDLEALQNGLQTLEADAEGSFLSVLEPQMEALLAQLGVPADELEGLDLEAMLARLQDLLDGHDLAASASADGKGLPLAALMAATDAGEPRAVGRGEATGNERSGRSAAASEAAPVKPLPAALMRLFLDASQATAGREGGASLKLDPTGMPGLTRENVLDVLAQWMTQGADEGRRGRSDVLSAVLPAAAGQAEAGEPARALPRLDLTRLLQQPNGARELADQVRMLAQAQGGRTELKLHPPQLGSLDVRVLVDGDRTSIQFISANPVTREVLEAAMPRLRDSLAESGLKLEDATVSDHAAEEQREDTSDASQARAASEGAGDEPGDEAHDGSTLSLLNRRLDLFA